MERKIFGILCLVLVMGMVIGLENDWGSISTGDNDSVAEDVGVVNKSVSQPDEGFSDIEPISFADESRDSSSGTYFTLNFYIAIGLIFLFLLILGFFSWLWLRGPKNKWERRKKVSKV